VARGAARTHARAETDEKSRNEQQRPSGRYLHLWSSAVDREIDHGGKKKSRDERCVVKEAAIALTQDTGDDAADPRYPAVKKHEEAGR